MQKILRTLIIIAMLITGYLLILAWRDDYTNVNKPVAITPTTTAVSSNDVPVAGALGTPTGDSHGNGNHTNRCSHYPENGRTAH